MLKYMERHFKTELVTDNLVKYTADEGFTFFSSDGLTKYGKIIYDGTLSDGEFRKIYRLKYEEKRDKDRSQEGGKEGGF